MLLSAREHEVFSSRSKNRVGTGVSKGPMLEAQNCWKGEDRDLNFNGATNLSPQDVCERKLFSVDLLF